MQRKVKLTYKLRSLLIKLEKKKIQTETFIFILIRFYFDQILQKLNELDNMLGAQSIVIHQKPEENSRFSNKEKTIKLKSKLLIRSSPNFTLIKMVSMRPFILNFKLISQF